MCKTCNFCLGVIAVINGYVQNNYRSGYKYLSYFWTLTEALHTYRRIQQTRKNSHFSRFLVLPAGRTTCGQKGERVVYSFCCTFWQRWIDSTLRIEEGPEQTWVLIAIHTFSIFATPPTRACQQWSRGQARRHAFHNSSDVDKPARKQVSYVCPPGQTIIQVGGVFPWDLPACGHSMTS